MSWRSRLRWLLRRDPSQRDLEEEMRAHLELEADARIEAATLAMRRRPSTRFSDTASAASSASVRRTPIIGARRPSGRTVFEA